MNRWLRIIFSMILCQFSLSSSEAQSLFTKGNTVAGDSMIVAFSTYIGGSTFEQIRDITCDTQGNVYITGGTMSPNFPTTAGAYQRVFKTGGTSLGSGGPMDVFVSKYSSEGRLLWSTYVGGPNYDRAYAIEVDDSGNVYLGGRAGEGFPTTQGALQESFAGDTSPNGAYGKQDAFVTKLSPDGSRLIWSTYFGRNDGGIIRDIDIDSLGNVYVVHPGVAGAHPHVTPNAFQKNFAGGNDVVVAKISADGKRVVWGTYFGGSGDDGGGPSIRIDRKGFVIIAGATSSTNLPVTTTAYDTSYNGGQNDLFIAKISPDGSSLVYSTYLGGSSGEGVETHNLAIDDEGNAYISSGTSSNNFPVTAGVLQRTLAGGNSDSFVSKISSDGKQLLASTYVGGNQGEFTQGMYVDTVENVYFGGTTQSTNFPTTSSALQKSNDGAGDFYICKLAADFSRLNYSTYFGGSLADDCRTLWADEKGNIFAAGQTLSRTWKVKNAEQSVYADTANRDDGCLVKFSRVENTTSIDDDARTHRSASFRISPNPASMLSRIEFSLYQAETVRITIFDMLGQPRFDSREIFFEPGDHSVVIATDNFHSGYYLCQFQTHTSRKTAIFSVLR